MRSRGCLLAILYGSIGSTERRKVVMAETTEFRIGAGARCSDGVCGAVTKVVVDPIVRAVTHLVIASTHGRGPDRLVPLDLVDSTEGEVHLRCTIDEFEKLEIAQKSHFLVGSSNHGNYGQHQAVSWPFYTQGGGFSERGVARAVTYD